MPSVASILTGKLPLFAGEKHEPLPLDPTNLTLAEVLSAAGYDAGAVVDNGLLNRSAGWDQGFARYVCIDRDEASETFRLAVEWLDRPRREPIFLWVHFLDPHSPYKDRPAYHERFREPADTRTWIKSAEVDDDKVPWDAAQTRNAVNLYDGEVEWTDRHVGLLLDRLLARPRAGRALIVFSADHGEEFLEHGHKSHGYDVYDENIRVPLIVRPPASAGATGTTRIAAQVRLIDLFPTILDYAGLPPRAVQGRSLRPLIERSPGWTEQPALSQASSGDFAARTGKAKLMFLHAGAAYRWLDLARDPREARPTSWDDVPAADRAEAARLKGLLDAYVAAFGMDKGQRWRAVDPATLDALKSLGYVRD